MGHIYQNVQLRAEKTATVRMLVDTGATYSAIPPEVAKTLGIRKPRRFIKIRLADGRPVRMGVDVAIFQVNGREAPSTILVGKVAEPILGVETIEALGLKVDPSRQRLIPSRPYAVRLGGYR